MRKLYLVFLLTSTLFQAQVSHAAPFTAGNIVVVRVGSGSGSLANTGAPVFLDEYTPAGTLVQSVALPTTASGSNQRLALSGTASSEGLLNRSADGQFLTLAGYDVTPPYGSSLSGTAAATVNRTVAIVDYNGNIDVTTALADYADANNPRAAVTTDGTNLWVSGGTGGIRYVAKGGTSSVQVSTAITNVRDLKIFNGQLYMSTSSGSSYRIGAVGTGTPTTSGESITALAGIPISGSPYQFFFADLSATEPGLDVLYIAYDDGNGIRKYSLVSGTWTDNGNIGVSSDAYRGLTGVVNGTSVTLYASRKGGTSGTGGGEIVSMTDVNGYNAAFTATPAIIATASANTSFRGIALSPASPLPVQLISFNGVKENNDIRLWWSVADEKNIASYTVEQSEDGKNYREAGSILPTSSEAIHNYSFTQAAAQTPVSFYRLRMNELDGTAKYSASIKINNQVTGNFHISPNPAHNELRIAVANGTNGSVQIISMNGAIVQQQLITSDNITVNIQDLASGQYLIKCLNGNNIYSALFLKD